MIVVISSMHDHNEMDENQWIKKPRSWGKFDVNEQKTILKTYHDVEGWMSAKGNEWGGGERKWWWLCFGVEKKEGGRQPQGQ